MPTPLAEGQENSFAPQMIFSYASSSTLYPCQWVSKWLIKWAEFRTSVAEACELVLWRPAKGVGKQDLRNAILEHAFDIFLNNSLNFKACFGGPR